MIFRPFSGILTPCVKVKFRLCPALYAALLALSSPARASGQQRTTPPVQASRRIAFATRVEHAPKLDGTVDDPLWSEARPITDFLQREPYENQLPTERTEVRILYTRNEVYFSVRCYDSHPENIVATELRRDVSQELDDYFEIVIDSSHIAATHMSFRSIRWEHSAML